MASIKWHGIDIAGGGVSILPKTRAEYEANKQALDASDLLIDITDEEPSIATADEIPYTASMSVKEALDSVCQINNPNMVETLTPQILPQSVGTGSIKYYKKGTKTSLNFSLSSLSTGVNTIGTMPQGYRPFETIVMPLAGNNGFLQVSSVGTVVVSLSTGSYASGYIEFDAFN